MKKTIFAALVALCVFVAQSQAQELLTEPVPVAYFTIPLAGNEKPIPAYGFQLARLDSIAGDSKQSFGQQRPPYLDLRFTQAGLNGLRLNGTEMLDFYRTRYGYNANDSAEKWWNGLNENQKLLIVLGSIAAVGCVLDWCEGGGGGSANGRGKRPPPSDMRLKQNITPLVTLENGLHLYSFKYLWDDTTYVGVMAQDLLTVGNHRDAVVRNQAGFYSVRYDLLGLKMITLEEWNRNPQNIYLDRLALASNL